MMFLLTKCISFKKLTHSIIYSKYISYNILFINRKYLIIIYLLFYFDFCTIYRSFNGTKEISL